MGTSLHSSRHGARPMLERIGVFSTCLADALWKDALAATYRILAHVGFEAVPVSGQTCCGQPAMNNGDYESARAVLDRARALCAGQADVVVPSTSCTAMLRHGSSLLSAGESPTQWWELGEFLWKKCGVRGWPALPTPLRVVFHPACHRRMLESGDCHTPLLALVEGLELVKIADDEQCCGFGGSFCATHPTISSGIAQAKLSAIREAGAENVVSTDVGCLAHLEGVDRAHGGTVRFQHFAEVLAACL